jgi:ABC-2 type transport system ATP-binding protein
MPPKVRVTDLRKRYGALEAVAGVSFDIHDGEVFGLLGPNGAGKTTTIECVLGLTIPDSGSIDVCGIDARRHPVAVRQKVGAALQTTSLHDRITPREALHLFGSFYLNHLPADTLIERFSLGPKADVPVDTLSGGQKQRLALALAFVNNPELVFLDEPTAGLDAHSRRELHAEIQTMRRDGHTVLLTTHDLDEAELLCDRIAIVSKGRIVATGSPKDLVARSGRMQQVTVETDVPIPDDVIDAVRLRDAGAEAPALHDELRPTGSEAPAYHGVSPSENGPQGLQPLRMETPTRLVLHTNTPGATVVALVSALESRGFGLRELHVQKATLEDVFVDLTATAPVEQTT